MALDFFGATLLGQVITHDNQVIDLFPRAGGSAAIFKAGDAGGVAPFLQEVTVEMGLGMNTIVTMKLAPPFLDAVELLDSTLIEKDSVLAVRWGYAATGQFAPWTRVVQLQPSVEFGMDVSISLNGQGFGWVAQRTSTDMTWDAKTPQQVVEEIAEKYNLDVVGPDGEALADVTEQFKTARKTIVQHGFNDWQFMRVLCLECGVEMWIEGERLYLAPLSTLASRAPARTFVYIPGAQRGDGLKGVRGTFGNGVYPLSEFRIRTPSLWLPGAARGQAGGDIREDTKEPFDFQATLDQSLVPVSGPKVPTPMDPGRVGAASESGDSPAPPTDRNYVEVRQESGKIVHPNTRLEGSAEAHQAELDRRNLPNITAEATTPGIPSIHPGEQVLVRTGVRRFDGTYMITKVTHTIGNGGYDTNYELAKAGYPDLAPMPTHPGAQSPQEATGDEDRIVK